MKQLEKITTPVQFSCIYLGLQWGAYSVRLTDPPNVLKSSTEDPPSSRSERTKSFCSTVEFALDLSCTPVAPKIGEKCSFAQLPDAYSEQSIWSEKSSHAGVRTLSAGFSGASAKAIVSPRGT